MRPSFAVRILRLSDSDAEAVLESSLSPEFERHARYRFSVSSALVAANHPISRKLLLLAANYRCANEFSTAFDRDGTARARGVEIGNEMAFARGACFEARFHR
jgi:hypothetical protein